MVISCLFHVFLMVIASILHSSNASSTSSASSTNIPPTGLNHGVFLNSISVTGVGMSTSSAIRITFLFLSSLTTKILFPVSWLIAMSAFVFPSPFPLIIFLITLLSICKMSFVVQNITLKSFVVQNPYLEKFCGTKCRVLWYKMLP